MALTAESTGRNPVRGFGPRILFGMGLVILAFTVMLARLYTLQIVRGEELSSQGQRNFVQNIRVPHDRGIIFDRFGRILVDNRPSLDLQVTPAFLGKGAAAKATLERLGQILGLAPEEVEKVRVQVVRKSGLNKFQPVLVKRDLSPREIESVEADRAVFLLDGVDIVEGRRRAYRYGALAAHVLGYVNEIDPLTLEAERAKNNPLGYELGDLIGREGIERAYESDLRGVDGYEQSVVDAKGRRQHDAFVASVLGEHRRVEPKPGKNVYLSIDLDLQLAAEASFKRNGIAGSVVAIDPNNGSVLAMVSAPEFDPNAASGALGAAEKAALDKDPLRPWLNRPIQGQFVPGSTFKVATALGALMHGVTPTEHVHCPGSYRMGSYTWRCHGTHGSVDLRRALQVSCDTYFYTMAGRMGIEPIAKGARLLGFGSVSGIPLRGERSGLIPDEAYHNRADKASGGYQKGMAINAAIGQGSVLITPLQLAFAYATLGNGGLLYAPRMIERVESADLRIKRRVLESYGAVRESVQGDEPALVRNIEPVLRHKVEGHDAALAAIREGLMAVTEPGGTGYTRRSQKVTMAGKSGTAQVVRIGAVRLRMEQMDYFHRDHAWFVGYAPAENPQIVVAVLNEHSGHGGVASEPVVTDTVDTFFALQEKRAIRDQNLTSGVPYVPPPAPKKPAAVKPAPGESVAAPNPGSAAPPVGQH